MLPTWANSYTGRKEDKETKISKAELHVFPKIGEPEIAEKRARRSRDLEMSKRSHHHVRVGWSGES